jgi:hypothetical protein
MIETFVNWKKRQYIYRCGCDNSFNTFIVKFLMCIIMEFLVNVDPEQAKLPTS